MSFKDSILALIKRLRDPFFLTEVEGYDVKGVQAMHSRAEAEPAVGTSAVIVRDGKVLLGRRRGSHAAGVWSTPGGHLEHGESFIDCVRREVAEETGLTVLSCTDFAFANNILEDESKHYVTLYFLCEVAPGEPMLLEPDKCEGWQWLDIDHIDGAIWPGMHLVFDRLHERGIAGADHP